MSTTPTVLLESFRAGEFGRSFRFDGLERVIMAMTPAEVVPALHLVERAVNAGRHAAGFVSYEAAAALNPDLPAGVGGNLPLVWFGVFRERIEVIAGEGGVDVTDSRLSDTRLMADEAVYRQSIDAIRKYIASGHTYQVNFTVRQRFAFGGDPFALYRRICRNQGAAFSAWIDTGRIKILSASPELFFALRDGVITMRPMKGTAGRLPYGPDDKQVRKHFRQSTKERAENLMIVDLVRNDLSVIAESGSVAAPSLFDIETYPTVHQMTSTVRARLRAGTSLVEIFGALFPCGSVTGAPKRRTMEIIDELENEPRGVYCGAIGFVSPGAEAVFSVGIRTAVLDTDTGTGELGVGSGVTWDSETGAEYAECLAKGAFLTQDYGNFSLIESFRWEDGVYFLLDRHLKRLALSSGYFGFRFNEATVTRQLANEARRLTMPHKVRLHLAAEGELTIESLPLLPQPADQVSAPVAIAGTRVDSSDLFLYHKTTRRTVYEEERERHPKCADVIFLNERGEVTEGSRTNVVALLDGKLVTPPVRCGLLPGTFREALIEGGILRESVLTLDDLRAADEILLINSVRGWRKVYLPENGNRA
jgi:para-aminobenzoate synthetase/4-amino-4-deoxychorismate lyase